MYRNTVYILLKLHEGREVLTGGRTDVGPYTRAAYLGWLRGWVDEACYKNTKKASGNTQSLNAIRNDSVDILGRE